MTEQTAVLDINGVSSGYGKALVVRNVSLTVGVGEIVALLGKRPPCKEMGPWAPPSKA